MRLTILVLTLTAVFICSIGFTGDVSAGKGSYFELSKGGDYKTVKYDNVFYHLRFSEKGYTVLEYMMGNEYSRKIFVNVPDQGLKFLGHIIVLRKTEPERLLFYRP